MSNLIKAICTVRDSNHTIYINPAMVQMITPNGDPKDNNPGCLVVLSDGSSTSIATSADEFAALCNGE